MTHGQNTTLPKIRGAHAGPILIGVSPYKLVMGENSAASIEAAFPRGATDLSFFVAHGKIEDVELLTDTHLKARYVAPRSYIPTVDVIAVAATMDGRRQWSYCTILLYGQGEARLQTQRGAKAIITIGDKVFGPSEADQKGYASIHVKVPPGMQFGYDAYGRPVDLHIPKNARTAIFVENTEVRKGQKKEISMFAVVVNPDGSIDESSVPTVVANRGLVREVRRLGRGAFEILYLPPIDGEGMIRIEFFVPMDESPPSSVRLNLVSDSQITTSVASDVAPQREQTVSVPVQQTKIPVYWSAKLGWAWEPPDASAFHIDTDMGALLVLGGRQYFAGLSIGLSTSETQETIDSLLARMTTWVFPVALDVGMRKTFGQNVSLLLLGQIGFVHVIANTSATAQDGNSIVYSESGTQGLVGVGTAIERTAGPGNILGGVRYVWFPGTFDTFNGVFSSLYLDLGYRFWFN